MAEFENLKELLKELKEAIKEIITEPMVLLLLASGVFLLILLYLLL
jgi:type II secretory pathway component PulF